MKRFIQRSGPTVWLPSPLIPLASPPQTPPQPVQLPPVPNFQLDHSVRNQMNPRSFRRAWRAGARLGFSQPLQDQGVGHAGAGTVQGAELAGQLHFDGFEWPAGFRMTWLPLDFEAAVFLGTESTEVNLGRIRIATTAMQMTLAENPTGSLGAYLGMLPLEVNHRPEFGGFTQGQIEAVELIGKVNTERFGLTARLAAAGLALFHAADPAISRATGASSGSVGAIVDAGLRAELRFPNSSRTHRITLTPVDSRFVLSGNFTTLDISAEIAAETLAAEHPRVVTGRLYLRAGLSFLAVAPIGDLNPENTPAVFQISVGGDHEIGQ